MGTTGDRTLAEYVTAVILVTYAVGFCLIPPHAFCSGELKGKPIKAGTIILRILALAWLPDSQSIADRQYPEDRFKDKKMNYFERMKKIQLDC